MIQMLLPKFNQPPCSALFAFLFVCAFGLPWAAAQNPYDVVAETFDGKTLEYQLATIADDGTVGGTGLNDQLNVADLLSLTNSAPDPLAARKVQLLLSNDSAVSISEFSSDGQTVDVISKAVVAPFSIECVKAVVWTDSKKVQSAIRNRSSENDQVVVDTGEEQVIVSGLLEKVTADKVVLNYNGESRSISRSIVLAIVTANLQPAQPKGVYGSVALTDGSVVNGTIKSLAQGTIAIFLDDRNAIQLPFAHVERIDIKSDRIVFLSDLTPGETDQRTLFGVERASTMDKSVAGNPLTLNGPTADQPLVFKRGVGMQSYSRMVFSVPEGFDRFQATVGIDVETQGRGDCVVVVSADGIQLWQERIRGADKPRKIDVDISGSTEFTLTVQTGEQYDLSDHVDWCNARFLKSK